MIATSMIIRKEAFFIRQHTTFLTILKQLVTEEEIKEILRRHEYEEVARRFTVTALLHFLVTAALQQWKSFRHGADVGEGHGLFGCHYSTVSKKAGEVPFGIIKEIFTLFCSRCNRQLRRKCNFPKELLLIDSTTVTVGKTRLLWAPYHGERAGVKLHTALQLSTQIPQKVVETTGLKHDSPMLDELANKDCIVVADRAYFQIERSDRFCQEGQPFVIRLKTNVELTQRKSLKRVVSEDSNIVNDFTAKLGTEQNRSDRRHRIVEFTDYEGKNIRVITNLYSTSAETVAAIYKARWGVELFFRWIKQNLNVPRLFVTTKNAVYNQLFAALLAYVIVTFVYTALAPKVKYQRLSLLSFLRKLLSYQLPLEWQVVIQLFFLADPPSSLGISG